MIKDEAKDKGTKIRIETSADLYKLLPSVIKNTKIYDFQGKYYDYIYEEALKIERSGGVEKLSMTPTTTKDAEVKIRKLLFQITYKTQLGQQLAVIGSTNALGCWNQDKALKMTWTEGNVWVAEVNIDSSNVFEYKFIFIANNKVIKWEDGNNRLFNMNDIKGLIEANAKSGTNDAVTVNNVNKQSYVYSYKSNTLTITCEWNQK